MYGKQCRVQQDGIDSFLPVLLTLHPRNELYDKFNYNPWEQCTLEPKKESEM